MKDRLRYRSDDRPRLKVFRECRNLIREVDGYVWDPKRRDPTPVKKHDHSADALRYLIMGVREWAQIQTARE